MAIDFSKLLKKRGGGGSPVGAVQQTVPPTDLSGLGSGAPPPPSDMGALMAGPPPTLGGGARRKGRPKPKPKRGGY